MLHCRDDIGQAMSGPWFPQGMMLGIQAKETNHCFIRQESFVSHGLKVLHVSLLQTPGGLYRLLPGHSTIPAWLVKCCRNGCPSERFTSVFSRAGGYKLLHFMEVAVLTGTFNAANISVCPSPDLCLNTILSWMPTDNLLDIMVWFVL